MDVGLGMWMVGFIFPTPFFPYFWLNEVEKKTLEKILYGSLLYRGLLEARKNYFI